MKVSELIARLVEHDPTADVMVIIGNETLFEITRVGKAIQADPPIAIIQVEPA